MPWSLAISNALHGTYIMCGNLYVASDNDIAVLRWQDQQPYGISVSRIAEPIPALQAVLTKPHVYCVSSNLTGDACGFRYQGEYGHQTRAALAEFLEQVLANTGDVQCFEWSHDNPAANPLSHDWVGPSDFLTWREFIKPDELLVVINES